MNTDLSSFIGSIRHFLWRYHLTMFIVIAVGSIALAIFSLLGVVSQPSDPVATGTASQSNFDQETIDRVLQLQDTPSYNFTLPTNQRNNPFSE